MSEITKIAWCDSTVNFWEGCTKVSAGCVNCYAEARDKRHMIEDVDHWGKGAPRRKSLSAVKQALALNRKPFICDRCGGDKMWAGSDGRIECKACEYEEHEIHRRRIFSLSLGDWLDPEVPIEWLAEMLDTIRRCDQVTWILCTKRPELWRGRMEAVRNYETKLCFENALWVNDWLPKEASEGTLPVVRGGRVIRQATAGHPALAGVAPENIWLLASAENQEMADKRAPELLKIPAVVRGLSCEPLLGPIDLCLSNFSAVYGGANSIGDAKCNWVITGGESGPNARPCNVEWIRGLVRQCKAAGVKCFVKQLGSAPRCTGEVNHQWFDDIRMSLKHPKGGDPEEWPADLRVRQFPVSYA